jgi:hypothetical protein
MTTDEATPDGILQLGLGFWGSKTLLSAVELRVFTVLAERPRTAKELTAELGLQPRGVRDFLDALVSLGMLERVDDEYANTAATDLFLDREKPSYVGGILEMANARLYPFWASLTAARTIAERFPWEQHHSVVDVGTAEGCLPVQLAMRHPHLVAGGLDLPPVRPVFEAYVDSFGLADRVRFHAGDFFVDDLPPADVLVMGRILHDWGLDQKLTLLRKAHAALPPGGALVVYDTVIDDDRRENTFGLLMSLNMLVEMEAGFDYTGAECRSWMAEAGFRDSYVEPLGGPDSMVVGIK